MELALRGRPRMERENLARRLRVLRAERDWGLVETAKRFGISPNTLADAEHGRRLPTGDTLAKIAQGYGVPLSGLFTDEPITLEQRGERMHLSVSSEEYIDIAVEIALRVWELQEEVEPSEERRERFQRFFREDLAKALRRSFEELGDADEE
jgi:transcriptional regulator with XRE-family HTH domain